jgi:hypothetical protein
MEPLWQPSQSVISSRGYEEDSNFQSTNASLLQHQKSDFATSSHPSHDGIEYNNINNNNNSQGIHNPEIPASVYSTSFNTQVRDDMRMSDISYNDSYNATSMGMTSSQPQHHYQQQQPSQHPITAAALMMAMRTSSANSSKKGSLKDLQPVYMASEETAASHHDYNNSNSHSSREAHHESRKEASASVQRESVKFMDDYIEAEDVDSSPVDGAPKGFDGGGDVEGADIEYQQQQHGRGEGSGSRASSSAGTKQRSRTESVQNNNGVNSTSATMFPPISNQKSIVTSHFTQMSLEDEAETQVDVELDGEGDVDGKRGLVEFEGRRSSSAGTGRKHVRNKTVGDEKEESSHSFFGGGETSRRSGKL